MLNLILMGQGSMGLAHVSKLENNTILPFLFRVTLFQPFNKPSHGYSVYIFKLFQSIFLVFYPLLSLFLDLLSIVILSYLFLCLSTHNQTIQLLTKLLAISLYWLENYFSI